MKNKKIIVGATALAVSLITLFGGGYFFAKKMAEKRFASDLIKNQSEAERKNEVTNPNLVRDRYRIDMTGIENVLDEEKGSEAEGEIKIVRGESVVVRKGEIKWEEPEDLGDLGLTEKQLYEGCTNDCEGDYVSPGGIKYVKSGEVAKGKFKGYDLIVIMSNVSEGMGSTEFYRAFKDGDNYIFIVPKDDPDEGEYEFNFLQAVFLKGKGIKEFNDGIIIEELVYPDELNGASSRQKFKRDAYANAFFESSKLKEAFLSSEYGQVWMTNITKVKKDDNSDIFERDGFYIEAPDGTTVSYEMQMDIFSQQEDNYYDILMATWNSGERNQIGYEKNPSGCGSGDYVYNETMNVDIDKDLVKVGKTDIGDSLYGYQNATSEGFRKLYNEIYFVKEGEQKLTPEEFLKIHPKVFWKDYFGRILAFYSTEIISPAECGKPVIYLYPEEKTKVSVKVEPGNGLSFTDPEYKGGWNVLARPNGSLTNLSDGKSYPYLFWEGSGDVYYKMPGIGFSVSGSDLDSFFSEKLVELGLISKEISDFKEFWIPKMRESGKAYYFVTFLSKRYIDAIAPLEINPKPDTIIRVMMDYKPMDFPKEVSGFKITTPQRKGFTAVEWGGMLK